MRSDKSIAKGSISIKSTVSVSKYTVSRKSGIADIYDDCAYETRTESFLKYGIDALVSLIMIKYLIGNFFIIIFKIISIFIEDRINSSNNNNTWHDYQLFCKYGHPIGYWFVIFSTWTLFLFMALRALKIELNRYGATFCAQLSPMLCVFGCVIACIYHSVLMLSIKYEVTEDGSDCIMSKSNNNWVVSQTSQLIITFTLAVFMIWGLVAFIKPVWRQKTMLKTIKQTLMKSVHGRTGGVVIGCGNGTMAQSTDEAIQLSFLFDVLMLF